MNRYQHLDELLAKDRTKNARFAGQYLYSTEEMSQIWNGDNNIEKLALSALECLDHALKECKKTDDMASYHCARFIGKIVDDMARYLHNDADGSVMLRDIFESYYTGDEQ